MSFSEPKSTESATGIPLTEWHQESAEVEARPIDLSIGSEELNTASGFSLDALIGMALSSNPTIAQAESAVAQAAGVHYQVGLKPNPTVGYFGQEIGNDGSGGQHGVFASQTIVRGDKLRWNRCVTLHDVNRLTWEAATQRRRVETDVRIRFYRALAAQQRLQRAKDFRENAATAVDVAKQRLDAQDGTKPDLLQSQLLVDEIDLSIRQSELEWEAAWAELAATIGQPSLQPTDLVGDFAGGEVSDVAVIYEEAVTASPQLGAARAKVDRARTNLQRQRNQVVPNLNVQLGLGVDDATDDPFANVQFGMPLPVHNRNQGNIETARSEYTAAIQNLRRLELRLRRDMAEVYRRYQSSSAAINKYEKTMLPRAEESLALVEEAQRAGEIDFLRVLTARQSLFNLQQKLITAKGELSRAEAEISGYLLTDALSTEVAFYGDDALRGQALGGP
ncbi:MAG: TolC family protein [Pirellulales bacterium]|nr:TolC family protein [Pirellulales bacterium]